MKNNKPGGSSGRSLAGRRVLIPLSLALLIFGAWGLIGYAGDLRAARRAAEDLRTISDAAATVAASDALAPEEMAMAQSASDMTSLETAAPTYSDAEADAVPDGNSGIGMQETSEPLREMPSEFPAEAQRLPEQRYPRAPGAALSRRFQALQEKNQDIVAWLTIGTMLDEPVVQRDNAYYMTHDATQRDNVNGAIFLDAAISLGSRPYTLILYGHNMKSGAMFGSLRNYEDISFYHNFPFITCDTAYEEGRYVVFAEGTVSVQKGEAHFLDFLGLMSQNIPERTAAIETLTAVSEYTCVLDVQPEDQLLLLVTCVSQDTHRRVVAARRVRDGETEDALAQQVRESALRR